VLIHKNLCPQLSLSILLSLLPQVHRDFGKLFENGFEIFDDLLGENIGVGKLVGFFEAFVSEPEDVPGGSSMEK